MGRIGRDRASPSPFSARAQNRRQQFQTRTRPMLPIHPIHPMCALTARTTGREGARQSSPFRKLWRYRTKKARRGGPRSGWQSAQDSEASTSSLRFFLASRVLYVSSAGSTATQNDDKTASAPPFAPPQLNTYHPQRRDCAWRPRSASHPSEFGHSLLWGDRVEFPPPKLPHHPTLIIINILIRTIFTSPPRYYSTLFTTLQVLAHSPYKSTPAAIYSTLDCGGDRSPLSTLEQNERC